MSIPIIPFAEGEALLDWIGLTDALAAGHDLPRAEIGDTFLYRDPDTLLSRAAWINGLGMAVKSATVFPGNPGRGAPMINGGVNLYSDSDGTLEAIVDFHLVTKWKTAGDSLLAARRLAEAVQTADIITSATMSTEPVIRGAWLRPGQHVDLIGAYRPDMREVDDAALLAARVFVDSYDTTVGHIGEIKIPLEAGTITREHLQADYYDLGAFRRAPDDITLFKNGGGAHLDLMTSRYILDRWRAQ